MQLWPSGKTLNVKSDDGGDPLIEDNGIWRPATADEQRAINVEQRAQRLLDNDVLCCDTSLVESLLEASAREQLPQEMLSAWELDRISNYNLDSSQWTIEQCRAYLDSIGVATLDPIANVEFDIVNEYRKEVEYHGRDTEIFEWWRVSKSLAQELIAAGECVLSNDYGDWYGRQTTGQGILMDGVLQRVAAAIINR